MSLPPSPPLPKVVQGVLFWRFKIPFFAWCRRRCGDRFTIWAPPFGNLVCLADPRDIKEVFTGDPALLHVGEAYGDLFRPVMGDRSLFTLDERVHLSRRKLLAPAFHGESLKRARAVIAEIAADEVSSWPAGRRIRLAEAMERIALEVVFRVVFGVTDRDELASLRARLGPVITPGLLAQLGWVVPALRGLGPIKRYLTTVEEADALLLAQIERRRRAPDLDRRHDILSMLVAAADEDGHPLSDREIRDELVSLLIAGHETTAMGLAWTFERLLRHPEPLARLRRELAEGGHDYLDAVVHEALRVRPVIMDAARRLTADAEIAGHRLPAGTAVATAIAAVQLSESQYDDPLAFRPERFLGRSPPSYGWIPFGGGVRRCVGASLALAEMKVVLETVLTHVELAAARPKPERGRIKHITLMPARGAEAIVVRRLRGAGSGGRSAATTRTVAIPSA